MAYPSSIVSLTNPAGTSLLTSPDHSAAHGSLNDEVEGIETTLGTNSGTSVLKNFTAGKLAARTVGETHGTSTWIGGTIGTANIGTSFMRGGTVGTATIGTSLFQGGTVNNAVLGSPASTGGTFTNPTIGSITVPGTTSPLSPSAALAPAIGTFNDGTAGTITGTHTANAQSAQIFYSVQGTGAGNRTIGTPLNPQAGQSLLYAFKSSGSANGTLVWQSAFVFSQDTGTPAIGTGTSWNYYGWRYNAIDSKWNFVGQSKNVI